MDHGESSETLAVAAAGGDRDSLSALYARHHRPLWGRVHARVGRDHALTDDVTGEVWARVVARISTYDPQQRRFTVWLNRVADHVVVDAARARTRRDARAVRAHILTHGYTEPASGVCPERAALAAVDAADLAAAVAELPSRARTVLELTVQQGMSSADAATVLGMTPAAVRQARSRALRALRPAGARVRAQSDGPDLGGKVGAVG